MSYLGVTKEHWLFSNSTGQVYGVPMASASTIGTAYQIAFSYFYG